MVYWAALGSRPATVLLKYLGQTIQTWRILLREKPDAVFVMSPPVIAGMVVYPYCALRRIPFVIDAHTGAFLDRRWRHFQRVQRWLCRRASTTIVTNTHLASLLASHGADSTILPDVPVKYPQCDATFEKPAFTVAVICSFDYDEPVDVIFDTARVMPDVFFCVTGDPRKIEKLGLELPPNLRLTGFLDNSNYGQLLRDADVVMALTNGKHKMLRAAYEAIYQGTPIIISDSPMLKKEFDRAAILVENSPSDIVSAIDSMRRNLTAYRDEALQLQRLKQARWQENKRVLMAKIGQETSGDNVRT
jgi:glycosyltransferase involved in cell wall biosynthesis